MIKRLLMLLWFLPVLTNANPELRLLNITGEPIKLNLSVGQEIQLNFESLVGSIGIPVEIERKINKQLIDSRIWLKATEFFEPTRVLVKDKQGQISVFLISANTSKQKISNKPIKYRVIRQNKKKAAKKEMENQLEPKTKLNYIDLTRYAAQFLYAPKRMIEKINVVRVPINTKKKISLFACSYSLACAGNVVATPIATWKSSHYYVSAVLLRNTTQQQIILDPRDLIGRWKAATFHFNRLGKAENPTDTSVVYLISLLPFEQSL